VTLPRTSLPLANVWSISFLPVSRRSAPPKGLLSGNSIEWFGNPIMPFAAPRVIFPKSSSQAQKQTYNTGSLNWNWLKHVVRVQLRDAVPERGLEYVMQVLSIAVLRDHHNQSRPFKWA
jgi:hypothetical protein